MRVEWWLHGDRLTIAVSDGGGPTVPMVNEPGSSAIGGRGLGIVERLSLRWGVFSEPDGAGEMTVWAELALNSDNEHADPAHSDSLAANGASGAQNHQAGMPGLVIAWSRDA